MAVASGAARIATWLTRLLQLFFAIILTGILSYMIHEFHEFHFHVPREVTVPEVFSVIAIVVCCFSIIAVCCLGHMLQLVAAFLDFAIFVGYIASAALLHHNFHSNNNKNPLRNELTNIRIINRQHDSRQALNSSLVKLLVACVVIQIILFFFTTLFSLIVVRTSEDRRPRRQTHTV